MECGVNGGNEMDLMIVMENVFVTQHLRSLLTADLDFFILGYLVYSSQKLRSN